MDISFQIYFFLTGPAFYITIPLMASGILRKIAVIISARSQGLRFPGSLREIPGNYDSASAKAAHPAGDPVLTAASTLFHIAVITGPFLARGHSIFIERAWALALPGVPAALTTVITVTAIATGSFLLMRRIFLRHVSAVSTWKDYTAMACVMVPFITGLMARSGIAPYESVMLIHCISGHILLIAMGWTRLGHMVFYTAGRLLASGPGMVKAA